MWVFIVAVCPSRNVWTDRWVSYDHSFENNFHLNTSSVGAFSLGRGYSIRKRYRNPCQIHQLFATSVGEEGPRLGRTHSRIFIPSIIRTSNRHTVVCLMQSSNRKFKKSIKNILMENGAQKSVWLGGGVSTVRANA